MLEDGVIEDIPCDFKPLQSQDNDGEMSYSVHPKVEEYVNHLVTFKEGLGIIRESKMGVFSTSSISRILE